MAKNCVKEAAVINEVCWISHFEGHMLRESEHCIILYLVHVPQGHVYQEVIYVREPLRAYLCFARSFAWPTHLVTIQFLVLTISNKIKNTNLIQQKLFTTNNKNDKLYFDTCYVNMIFQFGNFIGTCTLQRLCQLITLSYMYILSYFNFVTTTTTKI